MLSQTTEYALRAVVYLASHPGETASRQLMSEQISVPVDYLHKVLKELSAQKIVKTLRGPGGGYQLKCNPLKTTILDVVRVFQAIPRVERCPLGLEEHRQLCPLHRELDKAAATIEAAYANVTIAQLIPKPIARSACRFPKTP